MKNILSPLSVSILIMLSSCYHVGGTKIKGNGNVIEEPRDVFPFERLKVDGVINVVLIPGSKESVKIEADQNLLPYIHVFNNGKTLIVDTDDNIDFKFTKGEVYITFVNLSEIKHDGVARIKSTEGIHASKFVLNSNGVGSINLEIYCDKLEANLDGVGSIKLSGRASVFDLRNSGVGSVDAYHLESEYADVTNTGVGSTEVFAKKEISINSSGVGSVKYRGDAVVTKLNANGVGSVKKVN